MEGICGIISFDGKRHDLAGQVATMTARLSDGEQVNVSRLNGDTWALAAGAWDDSGWHPITFCYSDKSVAIVGVADIQNLDELHAKHRIPKDELGRLLAACYRSSESLWLQAILGSFAIIIVDTERGQMQAVTDAIGIRPLYWYRRENNYYFSSKIGSIRQVFPDLAIAPQALYAYMQHSMVPSPYTVYEDVWKLNPGHLLHADKQRHEVRQYWDISHQPKIADGENDISDQVYDTVKDAVVGMHNGMTGCFLSGGTDSSSICGILSKHQPERVSAFSIGFEETGYDELHYARIAARSFDLEHHEYYIQPEDVLRLLPEIVTIYDEPFGNASAIPTYFCASRARQHGVRTLLAGDGGDEIFAGNERYATQQLFLNYFKLPGFIRTKVIEPVVLQRAEKLGIGLFAKAGSYIRRAHLPDVERIHSYSYVRDEDIFTDDFLLTNDFGAIKQIPEEHYSAFEDAAPLDRHLYLDMKMTITDNDLRKVSRMCDLAQVRVRYPLLDKRLVDLSFRIPADMKLRGTSNLRYIFKRTFKDMLPEEILTKRKHGFGLPNSQWLRSKQQLKEVVHDILFDPRHLKRGYFKPDFIEKLWGLHLSDQTPYYGSVVWKIFMLEAWHRVHADGDSL